MARFMGQEGRVTVSLRRSKRIGGIMETIGAPRAEIEGQCSSLRRT